MSSLTGKSFQQRRSYSSPAVLTGSAPSSPARNAGLVPAGFGEEPRADMVAESRKRP